MEYSHFHMAQGDALVCMCDLAHAAKGGSSKGAVNGLRIEERRPMFQPDRDRLGSIH